MASFPQAPSSVQLARRYIGRVLAGLQPAVVERATMLVSELATNAILHADSDFEVTVTYPVPGVCVRIEVSDAGGGEPRPQQPPLTAEHGRGLQLVAALSDRWGVDNKRRETGKSVWFELGLSPDQHRARGQSARTARSASPARAPGGGGQRSIPERGLRLAFFSPSTCWLST